MKVLSRRLSLRDSKYLEDLLSGKSWEYCGHRYSDDDCQRISHAVSLWFVLLYDVGYTWDLHRVYSLANLKLYSSWLSDDLCDIMDCLSDVLSVVRDYSPFEGKTGFRSYKEWFLSRIDSSKPAWRIIRPLIYKMFYCPLMMQDVNSVLQFLKRLTLKDVDWVEEQGVDKYLSLEADMWQWEYDDKVVNQLRNIVTDWLKPLSFDHCQPAFSNGATSQCKRGAGRTKKVRSSVMTPELLALDAEMSFGNPYHFDVSPSHIPVSKGRFVPKGYDKKRFISMEDTANQYYQMGMFTQFDKLFTSSPWINVDLHDQEKSRRLCLRGSRDQSLATIDLSDASDSVTWKLVTLIFPDDVRRQMEWARTRYTVLDDGFVVALSKAFPMGSALCFPIECIVFSAVAALACDLCGIPRVTRVYGDDIIVDSRAYTKCVELLESLHFKVNREKSFGPYSFFLEACGMEAFYGLDITPLRLSRKLDIVKFRSGKSPQQLEAMVELSNQCWNYGYSNLRRTIIAQITSVFKDVPFSVNPETGIFHPSPGNDHLRSRFNKQLQRLEYKVTTLNSKCNCGDQAVNLILELERISDRDISDEILPASVRSGQTRTSLREEWRPAMDYL